ncbi:MAG TPA: hypothetical protein VLA01_01460, partial [Nitrosopumilaceae archaeon]|nr:hypothetical protein [Nitrosopumilaceae archaeon]
MKSELTIAKIQESKKETQTSICDLMKNNTSEVLQKIEYQIPKYLQGYSDLYTKYLHSLNTLYGTCYISEKQFFDKMGIDHKVLEPFDAYWKFIKNLTLVMIETRSEFLEDYIQFRIAAIESFDKSMASALDYYS